MTQKRNKTPGCKALFKTPSQPTQKPLLLPPPLPLRPKAKCSACSIILKKKFAKCCNPFPLLTQRCNPASRQPLQQQYPPYSGYPPYPGAYANRVHPPQSPHDTPIHSPVHKRNKETPTQQSGDQYMVHPQPSQGLVAHYQAYAPSHIQPHHYATSQTAGGASV
jgi:hypothetical protein